MSNDSIGGYNQYSSSSQEQANISISKTMHTHTVEKSTEDVILDQIVEASTADYQEDYIPSASSPTLTPADQQASDQRPNTSPSPQTQYLKNVQTALYNLPSNLLAQLGNGKSLDGLNKLIYAFNHPQAKVDPQVANILGQIKSQVLSQTQTALKLGADWTPEPPNSQAADKQIARDYNNVFESLVQSSDLSDEDVNRLLFYHYHPEEIPADDPLKQNLEEFENAAFQSVADSEGMPADSQKPLDSAQYDAQVSQFYDDAFNNYVDQDPDAQNLSKEEKSELETLHQFPDADVPDKKALQELLSKLEGKALDDTQKKFNLPDTFKPAANFKDFAAVVLGNYKAQFDANVQNAAPFTLTYDQKMLLMQTNGFSIKNLPPGLIPIYNALQAKTAADVAQSLGLPEDWLNATKNESIEDDSVAEKALSDAENNPEDQTGVQGRLTNKGINAFAKVLGKLLNTQQLAEVEFGTSSLSQEYGTILNAINLTQDAVSAIKIRTAQFANLAADGYITAQNGWLNAGDYTALIASCLDKLRRTVYEMQAATGATADKVNLMNLENSKAKQFISAQQREAQKKSAETSQSHQKDWSANITNAANATHDPVAIFFANLFVGLVKCTAWLLDTATGGLVTTICQAAGMTSLAQNPLEMLGVISHEEAQKMDLAMQIIAMVAQIAIEACLAQPELIAATIANISEKIAQYGALGAVKALGKQAISSIAKTAGSIVDDIASTAKVWALALKTNPKGLFVELMKTLGTAIKESALVEGLSATAGFIKKAGREAFENGMKSLKKLIDTIQDALGIEADAASKLAKAARKTQEAAITGTTAMDDVRKAIDGMKRSFKDIYDLLKDIKNNPKEHLYEIYTMGSALADTINATASGVIALRRATTAQEQAALKRLIGELDAMLSNLEAESKVLNKVSQMILDQLSDLVGWVGDINRQESDMFKKLPVHFISA